MISNKFPLFYLLILLIISAQQTSAQSLGDPVVKITFGSGTATRGPALAADSGSTTYTYSAGTNISENVYTITNLVDGNVHSGFVTSYDHDHDTNGGLTTGYMMVVNGNVTAGTVFTRAVPGLCGNTQYQFGVWIKNVLTTAGAIPPNMVFHIYAADGTTELGTGVSTGDVPTGNIWHNYTANFTLPAGTSSVIIKLVSNASGTIGNDFAVDDITFSPYGSQVTAAFNGTTSTTQTTCAGSGQTYTINATSTLATGYQQKLQLYANGTWTDLSTGSTQTSFTVTAPATAGTYMYRLVSGLADNINSANCVVASNNLTITATPSPTAEFSYTANTCLGTANGFTDASIGNGTTVNAWSWNFGEAASATNTSALQNPFHTYAAAGDYVVTLTLPGVNGCSPSVVTHTVHIQALPVASFTNSAPNCFGNAVTFNSTSGAGSGTLTSLSWDFGETTSATNTSALANPSHTYAATGSYNVTLVVVNSYGCTSAVTKTITITALPVADFTTPDVCLSDAFAQFTNTSIVDASQLPLSYVWDFGDTGHATAANPNTSTAQNPIHKYSTAGVYTVMLKVTTPGGCTSANMHTFTVNGVNPTAGFTVANAAQLCSDQAVSFTDHSAVTDFGNITKIEWYFDYGNNPTIKETYIDPTPGKAYTHVYPILNTNASKTYKVRLVAYSGITCVSVPYEQTINLLPVPVINFPQPAAVCINASPVQLAASEASGLAGTGVYAGTGVNNSGLFNPLSSGVGTFNITYTFTAANGCQETAAQSITANPAPTVTLNASETILAGGQIKLVPKTSADSLTYSWSPATGLSSTTIANPIASPTTDTEYTLMVTLANGCSESATTTVKVLQAPIVPNTFTPNGDGMNDKWNIKYLDSYPNNTVKIYNRYGENIFTSVGYGTPWDGTHNGNSLPVGVYYYIIDPKNGRNRITGNVTLIR